MGSKNRLVRLQRKVLQAAELGSVKLLRSILHSHVKRPSRKEQRRKSRKRGSKDDANKSRARDFYKEKKRSRKAERRESRENLRRGSDLKRKEVDSNEESADSGEYEEVTRHSKRARREDREFEARDCHRQTKWPRKDEQRETRRGSDLKHKDVREGRNSDGRGKDSDSGEEEIRHSNPEEEFRETRQGEDRELGARESRRQTKRPSKDERREMYRRGSGLKRKEGGNVRNSDGRSEDSDLGEEEIGPDSSDEEVRETGNGRHDGRRSEGGQTRMDHDSSSSNDDRRSSGEESNEESTSAESGTEEIRHTQPGRKNATSGKTVRNIVNCRDTEGKSPLHHACLAGSEDLVKYLMSKGASVHARDSNGDTPLHIAAKLGPASLVAILKDADADMEAFNDKGVTPSDILGEKEAAASRRAKMADILKDQQHWYSHVAEEWSDHEEPWWGGTEWGESDRPDWEDPLLERMAENRQGRGLYNEPFSLRDFLKAEKNKTQTDQERKKPKRKGFGYTSRPPKDDIRRSPEEVVIGPILKNVVHTQSYSQRWRTFSESYNLCVSYSSVPFPVEEGKEDTLREVLLQGINDPSMQKAALRKEMLKWHPDKFLLKWGVKLQGPDHDRIVARVNVISEAIHQLYTNWTTVK